MSPPTLSEQLRPTEALLTVKDMLGLYAVSRRTLYRLILTGDIPAPVRFGRRGVRWRATEVQAHLDSLKTVKN